MGLMALALPMILTWHHGSSMLWSSYAPSPQGQGTCVSVSISDVATSKRLGLDRYLLSLNWFSSSRSCWLVNAVRGRRHFPIKPDCGAAVEQTVGGGQGTADR